MKPGDEEINRALAEAQHLVEKQQDYHAVGRVLLYYHRHNALLERLKDAVTHYLHSGHGEREHAAMSRALDALRYQDLHDSGGEQNSFGLE